MSKKSLLFVIFWLATGLNVFAMTDTIPLTPKIIKPQKYQLNIEYSANVGMAIYISPISVQVVPAFKLLEDLQLPKVAFTSFPLLEKGAVLVGMDTISKEKDWQNPNIFACQDISRWYRKPKNLGVDVNGKYYILIDKTSRIAGVLCGTWAHFWKEPPVANLEKIENFTIPIKIRGEVKQELIYGGKSGSTIKIAYREFTSDDLARPAFSQDLAYDLSEGNLISFRTISIEVIEANNNQIKYKIVSY